MDVQGYLDALAETNRHRFGFLLAYGSTWLVAALVWHRFGPRVGCYAALFQGMVGLPLGLLLTAVAAVGERPEHEALGSLSIYLAVGQLLALPLVIVLLARESYVHAVAALAVVLAVHFVPYAWLYGTPLYLGVGAVVAVGAAVVVARKDGDERGALVCALTGATLLLGGTLALLL